MKAVKLFQSITLSLALGLFFAVSAQTENPTTETKTSERVVTTETKTDEKTTPTETKAEIKPTPTPAEIKTETKPTQTENADNEKEVINYYANYLKEYRLGPNDIISVEVFGQCPDYCVLSKTVPPTARISYPLIREGVLVGGKTVEEVAAEITKKLDEYIIEPKVTVTLEKAMSARYSVMGKVAAPGIRIMDRKVSLYEALIEAGGLTKDGDKKKVAVISFDGQGKLTRKDVNLVELESGKIPMIFLNPGDQVVVGGKGFTVEKLFGYLGQFSTLRLLFGSPF